MSKIGKDTTIFLDFDDTLFDYTKAINYLLEEVATYGLTKADWDETYAQIKKKYGLYNRKEHFKLMSQRIVGDIDLQAIHDKYIARPGVYLFKDALEFLERYKDYKIYIISYGETEYQRQKIQSSGVTKYTEDVIVTNGSKSEIISKIPYSEAIFIDDRPDHLIDVALNCKDVQTILIDRRGEHDKDKVRVYTIVDNLNDL